MPTYLFDWATTAPTSQPLPDVMACSPLYTAERDVTTQELQRWDQFYQTIRNIEKRLLDRRNVPKGDCELVHVRIIGYLLLYLPKRTQRSEFIDDLNRHIQLDKEGIYEDGILSMGEYMKKYLFRIFKDCANPAAVDSQCECDTVPEYQSARDALQHHVQDLPLNHNMARTLALERDGFRCVLTGVYDDSNLMSLRKYTDQLELAAQERALGKTPLYPRRSSTKLRHIIAECVDMHFNDAPVSGYLNANSASHMWKLLELFDYACPEELNDNLIHRLENVLTLLPDLHVLMGKLELWFEATETTHRYKVCMTDPGIVVHTLLDYVTFGDEATHLSSYPVSSSTANNIPNILPLPDPRYLELHAICCRVARMSGAAEAINEIERQIEDTMVLANDGTDARLLDCMLVGIPTRLGSSMV